MERYIEHFVKSEEKYVDSFLKFRIMDPERISYGTLEEENVIGARPTIYVMATAAALLFHPLSKYYKSDMLYEAMNLAMDGVARIQRESGFFDYPCCNFYSAPDSSFMFKRLFAAYRLLIKYNDVYDTALLQKKYLKIMKSTAGAISEGGFHTPNHRWAICAALMQASNLFSDDAEYSKKLKDRTVLYLQEGIDGNADGEYAERSTGNYNAVVNNSMMALYQETKDVSYLGYVERNLKMMQTYIEPDDTVFTQNSTRQDKGKKMYMDKYFYQYLYMAVYAGKDGFLDMDKDERDLFEGAAHKIIRDNMERGGEAPDCLHILMLHEEMLNHHFEHYGFVPTYRKFYKEAGVLRVKNDKYAYTVINGRSAFLYFNANGLETYLKIGESYCEIRNFVPQEMVTEDKKTVLSAVANGWYYLPWKEKPETSDWWKMDNSKRERMITSDVHMKVTITELEDGLDINVDAEGLAGLPMRIELCVPAEISLENEHFCFETRPGESMILKKDYVYLKSGYNKLMFGPGFCEHQFKGHYSGEEINSAGYTIYCNAYTPSSKTFSIRVK